MSAEVIRREVKAAHQSELESSVGAQSNVSQYGNPNVPRLPSAFRGYFGEPSESWVQRYGERADRPQLVLHAYTPRVIKS